MKRRNWAIYIPVFLAVMTLAAIVKLTILDHLGGDPGSAATITGVTIVGFWFAALILANIASKRRRPTSE